MSTASAPGKIILVGEHAVVYGRPAIAAPVWEVQAQATVSDTPGEACRLVAPQIGLNIRLADAAPDEPLALVARLALGKLGAASPPEWRIEARSDIPMASGLGSGAAISAAVARAIFAHAGREIDADALSQIVFASERIHHGRPSGIDNTVIAWEAPIWFVKGEAPQAVRPGRPFTIVIADSGVPASTRETVAHVRQGWERDQARYEGWFDEMGEIAAKARTAIEAGQLRRLGRLFDKNQTLLERIGVSSPTLERLIDAARHDGALGAKLSGGGRGGNVIALVEPAIAPSVEEGFLSAGAHRVITTTV